jgi:malonyl-CoA O-methyltransferase
MAEQPVRASFDRAAETYDTAATLQRQVCRLLLAGLAEDGDVVATRVLDAGCGTGYAIGLLSDRWPEADIVAADFAPAMIAAAGGTGVCADIEALPFADDAFDLYWSSLTFQWCDPFRAAHEAARVLVPGGRFAGSSLAPGTLRELDTAFAGIDDHRHVLEFAPAEALAEACAAAGLADVRLERRPLRLHHPDLATMLRGLKALGAHQVARGSARRRPGLMGRRAWQAIEARYEAHRDDAGLPATYEVILCLANKRSS